MSDDFDDATLNLSHWVVDTGTNYSLTGGTLVLTNPASTNNITKIRSCHDWKEGCFNFLNTRES